VVYPWMKKVHVGELSPRLNTGTTEQATTGTYARPLRQH
jgi:hypothetical protein